VEQLSEKLIVNNEKLIDTIYSNAQF